MKEKVIFTTVLCLSAMTPMMAQNITGKVMNTKGEPLAFANVVLLNRTDSAFVKGAVSGEDGSFAIDSSCNGGIIKVTSVGYKTICKDCTGENVGIIKMEEDSKMLGEVVVKSSLPKTILKNGGMTTTIVGSVLEKAGTMENLLDRIPNVSAQNGSIKVFGRGEVQKIHRIELHLRPADPGASRCLSRQSPLAARKLHHAAEEPSAGIDVKFSNNMINRKEIQK